MFASRLRQAPPTKGMGAIAALSHRDVYGCGWSERVEIDTEGLRYCDVMGIRPRLPSQVYSCNRSSSADYRNIIRNCNRVRDIAARSGEWEISFPEWWAVWLSSGRFGQKGQRPDNYVLCRVGDWGPYRLGNVFVATVRENGSWGGRKPLPDGEVLMQQLRALKATEAAWPHLVRWGFVEMEAACA